MASAEYYPNFVEQEWNETNRTAADTITRHAVGSAFSTPIFSAYIIIGVLLFFVVLFLANLAYQIWKNFQFRNSSNQHLYSPTSSEEASLEGDYDDESIYNLYRSCALYVDDPEVNTSMNQGQFEYDTRSVDVDMLEEEAASFVNEVTRQNSFQGGLSFTKHF